MPRTRQDEAEVEETPAEATEEAKAPKRGDLPDGFVTPIGFAKILTEKGLHKNREGATVEVRPQMVYSYMRNSPQGDRLEAVTVTDSNGVERQALNVEEALAWWERKNARVEQRKANAAEKAEKKAQRAAQKAEAEEAEAGELETAEAE